MRINGNILQEMLDNVGVMEHLSFFKTYIITKKVTNIKCYTKSNKNVMKM